MTYEVIRDIVAVIIYLVGIGGNAVLWKKWQNRGAEVAEPTPTSEYGRPLVREGAGT